MTDAGTEDATDGGTDGGATPGRVTVAASSASAAPRRPGPRRPRSAATDAAVLALGLAGAVVAGLAATVLGPDGAAAVAVPVGALVLASLLVVVPVRHLPSLALVLFVALPQQAVGYGLVPGASAAAMTVLAWAARRWWVSGTTSGTSRTQDERLVRVARTAGVVVLLWGGLLLVLVPPVDTGRSLAWLISFGLAAVLPVVVGATTAEVRSLLRTWSVVTVLCAAYVVVELALGRNLVYSPLYELVGRPLDQEWSGYRSHGSFGHPLYAGTFFAVSFAVAVGRWLRTGHGRLWAVAALAGAVVTVSRGALLACAAAALVALVVGAVGRRPLPGYRQVVVLVVVGAAAVWATGLVQGRSGSQEGASSAEVRTSLLGTAVEITGAGSWLGSGAGTADVVTSRWLGQEIPMESSWLQLLVSLGVVGLVAVVVLVGAAAARATRRGDVDALAALVAVVVSFAGYNAIETLLPLHVLLGLVLLLALSDGPGPVPAGDPVPVTATPGPSS